MTSANRLGFVCSVTLFLTFQIRAATPLLLGTTYAGALTVPGETNAFTFTGTPGQRLYFDSQDADALNMYATLFSPSGVNLNQRNDDNDFGPLVLTEPGTYQLVINGIGSTIGAYQFRLLDLSSATALTLGTTLADQLSPSLSCNTYQFQGVRGQRVSLQSIGYSSSLAQWQLISPVNTVVPSTTGLASGQINQSLGIVTLPMDGAYCLLVSGAVPGTAPLTFQVLLSDVSDTAVSVSGFGTPHAGTVNANQTNSFSYTAPAGLPVYYDSLDASGQSLVVDLMDPNGKAVFSVAEIGDSGPFILPRSGTYTLNVRGPGGASGNFNFRLLDLTSSPVLPLNTTVNKTLATPYQTDVYQLSGTAGQRLYYDSQFSASVNIQLRFLGPDGQSPLSGAPYYDIGPATLPFAGTYYLFFQSSINNSPSYVFQMLDIGSQPQLPLNVDLTATLPANVTTIYQLAGTNGEQLYFRGKYASVGGAYWTLYDGKNASVGGANLSGDFQITLPQTATYALVLAGGANAVTYSNQVNTFAYATNALAFDTLETNNILNPGDQVIYTFTGTPGQRVYYDALNPNYFSITVALVSPNGVTLNSGNASYDFGPVTLPAAGTYTLVFSASGHTTGSLAFQLLDVASQPALPLNTDLVGALPANTSLLYQLTATSGELLYFHSKAVSAGGASWTLYGPNNLYVGSANFNGDFEPALVNSGNYVLVITGGANPLTYSNQVNTFTYTTNALALGTLVTNNLVQPGDQLFYTFTGTAGQRVYFDALGNYLSATVTLISPTGLTLYSGNPAYDFGPLTLLEPGLYTLQFDGSGHTTGGISFELLDIAAQSQLPLNTDLTGTLPINTSLVYQLAGTSGEQLYFNSKAVTGGGGAWTLYGPNNTYLGSSSLNGDFEQTLQYPGNYVLVMTASSNPLTYSNQVNTFSFITNAMTLGTATTSALVHPGDQLYYTFSGTVGQRIYYDSRQTNSLNATATLVSPTGVTIFSVGCYSDQGPFTLTQNGTYTLVLNGNGHTTGVIAFNVLDLAAATPVTLGSTITDSLSDQTQTRFYSFAGTVGQRVNLQSLSASGNQALWGLVGLANQFVGLANQGPGPEPYITANIGVVTLPAAGAYTVAVIGYGQSTAAVNYQLKLTDVSDPASGVSGFGTVNSGTVAASQTNRFTYSAPAGLPVFFDSQDTSGQNLLADLVAPDGTVVFSVSEIYDSGPYILPRSGTYTLNIRGNGGASGNFSFRLLDLSTSSALALNAPVNAVATNPYETDVYQFTSSSGQRFIYDALTNDVNSPSVYVQMLDPRWQGPSAGPYGGDFATDRGPFTVQYAGTCYLFFRNNRNVPSGYSFQMLDISAQPALPVNVSVTNTLGVYPELVYQYTGTAGQSFYFNGQPANPGGYWYFYDPNNNTVPGGSAGLTGNMEVTLPQNGTYALVLASYSASAGTEVFQVNDFSYITNSYTVGTSVVDAINKPGERKFYTFSGTLGQRLVYDALTNDPPSPNLILVQLLNPQGAQEGPINGRFSTDRGPFTLQQSGTYTLVIDGSSASVGPFAFRLLDVTAQPVLPVNTPVTSTLDVYPLLVYRYAGTAGQQLYFRGQASNPSGNWTLYDPDNNQMPGSGGSLAGDIEVTLPLTGTYTLLVNNYGSTAGTESFQVNDFSYITNSYTIGTSVVDAISRPGERKFYTFTGTLGQQLVYDALTNDPPSPNVILVQLFNPQGAQEGPIGGRFSTDRGPFSLQQSGTYTLMIDGSAAGAGSFAFRLLDVSAQPVMPISTAITNILDVYPLLVYRYPGVAGQPLYLRGSQPNPSGFWTLYDPDNNTVAGAGLAGDFKVALPLSGTYTLVLGSYAATAATEVFQINPFNAGQTLTINSAPVLSHIGNQSVPLGVTVAFTAQASDPDNDSLTFSLDAGAPAGATINPSTGAFSWTPPQTGSPSVATVTVRVTDNGTPPLSAAQTISIDVGMIIGLQMITVHIAPGTAAPSWHSTVGKHYRLQYKNNLGDPAWTAVGADVTATDVISSQVDNSISGTTSRYYRVQQLD